jgi:hypothetical protein
MRKASLFRSALAALLLSAAPALAQGAGRDSAAQMRQWAEDTARDYLQAWSAGGDAVPFDVRDFYGPRVSFFGRTVDRGGLYAEKRRFARRWPVRRYQHRPGTMSVSCAVESQPVWCARSSTGRRRRPRAARFRGARPASSSASGSRGRDLWYCSSVGA